MSVCEDSVDAISENIVGDKMSHLVTKPTKWHVRPAKTQISLGIRTSAQSEKSLRCPHEDSLGP